MSFHETKRQTLHVSMLVFALLLRFLPVWGALLCATAAFLHNFFILPRTGQGRFNRPEDTARGYPLGILLYPVTVFLLILLFGGRMYVAGAAWAVLAFGDGFATIVGKRFGRHVIPWCPDKTWEGTLAYLVSGGMGGFLIASWISSPALDGLVVTLHPFPPELSVFELAGICFAGSSLGAIIETLPLGIDDNLSAPLAAGFLMFILAGLDLSRLGVVLEWGEHNLLLGFLLTAGVGILSYWLGFVSRSAFIAGLAVGVLLIAGAGIRGFGILLAFFLIGSAVSKLGYQKKLALGAAQDEGGRRGGKHAAANCLVGVILAVVSLIHPLHAELFLLGMVAAFATALADTTSSELGSLYGKRPILLTTFQTVPPGTEGAVSVEGTLIGIAFAALLSMLGWLLALLPASAIAVSTAGAFAGMSFESYLGAATKELDNEVLNFLNTLVGATVAILLGAWLL